MLRGAAWRRLPASDPQKRSIQESPYPLTQNSDCEAEDDLEIEKLTKGEAANILTRMYHGKSTVCAPEPNCDVGCET